VTVWHNDEAEALAKRVENVVRQWRGGAICPSEFLFQLDLEVRNAKAEKARAAGTPLHVIERLARLAPPCS